MCGICGFISGRDYNENVIREMNDTMRHRGPDDAGVFNCQLKSGM